MDSLLVHRLPERSRELTQRARHLLTAGSDDLHLLVDDLVGVPEGPISLVFTGQYNAGKSTLIRALTGRDDILVDSDVATSETTSYDWGQVLLTDTPGVQSGTPEHDEAAQNALLASDLVVFVVSVDLFDDAGARHLDRVAQDFGKRRSMVVVVNKVATLDADPDVRRRAVEQVLGGGITVPIVLTDADIHMEAASQNEPDYAAELRTTGNVSGLEEALNSLIARSGQEGRLRRPFEHLIAVCAQALQALTDDPKDALARSVINRQRRLVTTSRRRLERAFESRTLAWKQSMHQLGEELADSLDHLDDLEQYARSDEVKRVEETFRTAGGRQAEILVTQLRADVQREASMAAQELRELAGSPQLEFLVADGLETHPGDASGAPAAQPGASSDGTADLMRKIGRRATEMSKWWGVGTGTRDFAGSNGHRLVYDIGKRLGKDFKPWEAVRYAETVGRGAQFVSKAMPYAAVGLDVLIAVQGDRAESAVLKQQQARRRTILDRARRSANEVESEVRARVDASLADFYGHAIKVIEEQQGELDALLSGRSGLRRDLATVAREAAKELATLAVADSLETELLEHP